MQNKIKIIFFGDIVGRPGRKIVKEYLSDLLISENKPDFVIANVENASHGFGLTEKNHNDFIEYGIDCFTSGNHIWDKKEVFNYIDESDRLIRPINYPEGTKGVGSRIFEKNGVKIGVINVLGRVFMTPIDSPWEIVKQEIERIKEITPVIIIDFHAEATAEKVCFGIYCSQLGATALFGTHTHIQTADEKIINDCMGYITDAGFCGASSGVIGMEFETSFKRLATGLPERFDIAESDKYEINAVEIVVDTETGKTDNIKRIKFEKLYDEVKVC